MARQLYFQPRYVRESGFSLIVTLALISVMAFFILTQMQSMLLYSKAVNQIQDKHDDFIFLEKFLHWLNGRFDQMIHSSCVLRDEPAESRLVNQRWCETSYLNQLVHYQITYIGDYPCLKRIVGSQTVASGHWLLRVSLNKNDFIEIRLAKAIKNIPCSNQHEQTLEQEILSWRHVSSGRI